MTDEARARELVERMPDTVTIDRFQVIEKEWLVKAITAAFHAVREECAKVAEEVVDKDNTRTPDWSPK